MVSCCVLCVCALVCCFCIVMGCVYVLFGRRYELSSVYVIRVGVGVCWNALGCLNSICVRGCGL